MDLIHKHKPEDQCETAAVVFNFVSYFEALIEGSKAGTRLMVRGKKAGQKFSPNVIKNYGSTLAAVKRYMGTI